MPSTWRNSTRNAWERALAAHEAQLASTVTGDEQLARSAVRLSRSHDCLKQSNPRVDRGRQRHRDPHQ